MNSNYNEEGSNTLYKSRPTDRSRDKEDDKLSSLTRKSSSKSVKGLKQIIGMNTFK